MGAQIFRDDFREGCNRPPCIQPTTYILQSICPHVCSDWSNSHRPRASVQTKEAIGEGRSLLSSHLARRNWRGCCRHRRQHVAKAAAATQLAECACSRTVCAGPRQCCRLRCFTEGNPGDEPRRALRAQHGTRAVACEITERVYRLWCSRRNLFICRQRCCFL